MTDYETRRLENIKRNQALIDELGLQRHAKEASSTSRPALKKQKLSHSTTRPTRNSARIAAVPSKPVYNDETIIQDEPASRSRKRKVPASSTTPKTSSIKRDPSPTSPPPDLATIKEGWTNWKPTAQPPTRDENGTYHFLSHPTFQPNKSPAELLAEGVFGGSYYRPLYSRALHTTISDDWTELPPEWMEDLKTSTSLML